MCILTRELSSIFCSAALFDGGTRLHRQRERERVGVCFLKIQAKALATRVYENTHLQGECVRA